MDYGALTQDEEESQPLVGYLTRQPLETAKQSWSKDPRLLLVVSLILMVDIAVFLVTATNNAQLFEVTIVPSVNGSVIVVASNNASKLRVQVTRVGYEPSNEAAVFSADYRFLDSYNAIIEPYADMEMYLMNYIDTLRYKAVVCSEETSADTDCHELTEQSPSRWRFIMPCVPHDKIHMRVLELNGTSLLRSCRVAAICLYVRREIRSLTAPDRDRFLNASHMLSQVSEETGQQLYGPRFHSYGYLVKFHYFNAAWQDADHFHEGNGFLTQHIKITNIFEAAIQSVDPSVCVPYWDFTIDSAVNATILDSYVTQPDLYGAAQLPTNGVGYTYTNDSVIDARILGGRWHNLKAEMNTHFSDLRTGYGYLRSPWNVNPSPYVSRYTLLRGRPPGHPNFPSCANHYELLQVTRMMDFFFDMQLLPHGAVHIELGGTYGCETLQPMLDAGYILDAESLWGVCRKWFIILKEGYRANYFLPAKDCVVDAVNPTLSKCPLTCTPGSEALYYGLFAHVMGNNINTTKADSQHAWYKFICTHGWRILPGDHLESASPADPSFWVIHPTLERLLHAKLMSGGFHNESWPSDVHKGFVCNKARCYSSITGTKDFHSDCCYGHYEFDQMFDGASGNRSVKVGPTNRAVLDATDPHKLTYSMPYIYDSFAWPHCAQDISALLRAMKANFTAFANASSEYQYHIDEEKIQRALRSEY